jgi:hypothetical protein
MQHVQPQPAASATGRIALSTLLARRSDMQLHVHKMRFHLRKAEGPGYEQGFEAIAEFVEVNNVQNLSFSLA